jgi:hypothetical protein
MRTHMGQRSDGMVTLFTEASVERMQTMANEERGNQGHIGDADRFRDADRSVGMGRTGEKRMGNGDDTDMAMPEQGAGSGGMSGGGQHVGAQATGDMSAPRNPAVGASGANFGETDPGSTLTGAEIDENGMDDNIGATGVDESRRPPGGAA